MRIAMIAVFCSLLSACATTQEIHSAQGSQVLVACGAATGWDVCYAKANTQCPSGYDVLEKDAGFNRKEMRISCR